MVFLHLEIVTLLLDGQTQSKGMSTIIPIGMLLYRASERDRLIVISGLSRFFFSGTDDEYLAGLRKSDWIHGLLWCPTLRPAISDDHRDEFGSKCSRFHTRAPTATSERYLQYPATCAKSSLRRVFIILLVESKIGDEMQDQWRHIESLVVQSRDDGKGLVRIGSFSLELIVGRRTRKISSSLTL